MDKKPLSRTAQYYSKVPITKRHGGNFDIFELISKYRDYECLWNYKCLDYKNKRAKQRCWIRIARYFNTEVELVKSKMKNLRAAYLMEKKKVQKSLLAGGTPYTPNLFYYKYLSFLDDVVILRHDLEKIDIIEHVSKQANTGLKVQDKRIIYSFRIPMMPANKVWKMKMEMNMTILSKLNIKWKRNIKWNGTYRIQLMWLN